VLVTVLVVLAAAGLTWSWTGPRATIADLARPSLGGHPVLLAANLVSVLVYAVAAWHYTRQAAGAEDHLLRWLGAGCLLGAFSGLHYAVYPSLYSDYLYSGDVLRLGFYVCLLVGAAKEIRTYFELRTRMAVLAARRRVARDLHDGLAQELSYLWSQSQAMVAAGQGGDERLERIAGAAGRALDEARRAIASLTRPLDEPFPRVLQQTADDLAGRYGVSVVTDLDPAATVALDRGEALLRIAAEAIRNAVRHGHASRIDVELRAAPLSLTVRDDGRGFSPGRAGAVRAGGFGLTSMRERAEGMGGRLEVTSAPGEGTTVRVTWA
jgi:signal transduction histidine kinase